MPVANGGHSKYYRVLSGQNVQGGTGLPLYQKFVYSHLLNFLFCVNIREGKLPLPVIF